MDAAKAVLRGNFIAIQSYLKKQEKHWIDNWIILHLKLGKEQQQQKNQTKINRRKEAADPSRNKWKRNERNTSKD